MSRGSWIVALLVSLAARASAVTDITICGQTVPPGETAILQTDLDCGSTDAAVVMERSTTLFLNGHTIAQAPSVGGAINCTAGPRRRCRVVGPGTVSGGYPTVGALGYVSLEGLTVSGAQGGWCVIATNGRAILEDVTVSGCPTGVYTGPYGIMKATNVTVLNSVGGIEGRVRGRGLTVSGCFIGIASGGIGSRGSVRLVDSTITGKTTDILSDRRPRLHNSTCDRSENSDGGAAWGVCTLD